jgi:hypothetical protein
MLPGPLFDGEFDLGRRIGRAARHANGRLRYGLFEAEQFVLHRDCLNDCGMRTILGGAFPRLFQFPLLALDGDLDLLCGLRLQRSHHSGDPSISQQQPRGVRVRRLWRNPIAGLKVCVAVGSTLSQKTAKRGLPSSECGPGRHYEGLVVWHVLTPLKLAMT